MFLQNKYKPKSKQNDYKPRQKKGKRWPEYDFSDHWWWTGLGMNKSMRCFTYVFVIFVFILTVKWRVWYLEVYQINGHQQDHVWWWTCAELLCLHQKMSRMMLPESWCHSLSACKKNHDTWHSFNLASVHSKCHSHHSNEEINCVT